MGPTAPNPHAHRNFFCNAVVAMCTCVRRILLIRAVMWVCGFLFKVRFRDLKRHLAKIALSIRYIPRSCPNSTLDPRHDFGRPRIFSRSAKISPRSPHTHQRPPTPYRWGPGGSLPKVVSPGVCAHPVSSEAPSGRCTGWPCAPVGMRPY